MAREGFLDQLLKRQRPVRELILTPGDPGCEPVTKISGVPWWPADLLRPTCGYGHNMSFMMQCRLSDVPGFHHLHDSLVSFHYCDECMLEGNMSFGWNCFTNKTGYDVSVITDVAAGADAPVIPIQIDPIVSKDGYNYDENGEIKLTHESPSNYGDVVTNIGGPDGFGYVFIDSEESNGPEYSWIDISGVGTPITFNGGFNPIDDGYSDPIPMGMNFEFYGVEYSDVQVSTNGWISFI